MAKLSITEGSHGGWGLISLSAAALWVIGPPRHSSGLLGAVPDSGLLPARPQVSAQLLTYTHFIHPGLLSLLYLLLQAAPELLLLHSQACGLLLVLPREALHAGWATVGIIVTMKGWKPLPELVWIPKVKFTPILELLLLLPKILDFSGQPACPFCLFLL